MGALGSRPEPVMLYVVFFGEPASGEAEGLAEIAGSRSRVVEAGIFTLEATASLRGAVALFSLSHRVARLLVEELLPEFGSFDGSLRNPTAQASTGSDLRIALPRPGLPC